MDRIHSDDCLTNRENLKDAFIGLVTDMKRVKKYGFSGKDLALSKEDMLKKNAVNINSMADLKNGQYVEYIVRHFTQDEPLITDRERLQLERKILEEITLNVINSSKIEFFQIATEYLYLQEILQIKRLFLLSLSFYPRSIKTLIKH